VARREAGRPRRPGATPAAHEDLDNESVVERREGYSELVLGSVGYLSEYRLRGVRFLCPFPSRGGSGL